MIDVIQMSDSKINPKIFLFRELEDLTPPPPKRRRTDAGIFWLFPYKFYLALWLSKK